MTLKEATAAQARAQAADRRDVERALKRWVDSEARALKRYRRVLAREPAAR